MRLMSRKNRTYHPVVYHRAANWQGDADCNSIITIPICSLTLMRISMRQLLKESLWHSKCTTKVVIRKVKHFNWDWRGEAQSIIRQLSHHKTVSKRPRWCKESCQGSLWVIKLRWQREAVRLAEIITTSLSNHQSKITHTIVMTGQVPKTSPMTSRTFWIN